MKLYSLEDDDSQQLFSNSSLVLPANSELQCPQLNLSGLYIVMQVALLPVTLLPVALLNVALL